MSTRFFLEQPIVGNRASLHGPEAHHAVKVMRVRAGDQLLLFRGDGREHCAEVVSLSKDRVDLRVVDSRQVDREAARPLTLAVALPKGERQRWLLEKCVELGVQRVVPVETERSVARVTPKVIDRLRRQVVEASKQCGRLHLLEVQDPQPLSQLLEQAERDESLRYLVHPQAAAGDVTPEPPASGEPVLAAVGPEGGFSPVEVQQARAAGWLSLDLGPRLLRVETAVLALAVAFCLPVRAGPPPAP